MFWYLFQLLLLVVLAPFLYWIICRKWSGLLWLLLLITALWKNVSLPILNLDALFYYSAAGYAVLFLKRWKEKIHLPGKKSGLPFLFFAGLPYGFLEDLEQLTFYTGPYCSDPFTGSAYFLQYFKRNTLQTSHFYSKKQLFPLCHPFSMGRFFNKAGAVLFKGNQGLQQYFS